ncbi:putative sulfiredoxin isoform X2 [Neodiprion lecontei]|uniref:Sulfiredoxin isoform X2 n=1 Tax=Neodiprion lecontei TaxID=441921 RepID=A0ABM3FSX4_NEOLC|nr:putative sulfiredoxin isoform X2 [Neodiprion lecontei]
MSLQPKRQYKALMSTAFQSLYPTMSCELTSIHAGNITEIHEVPMRVVTRPFPPEVNEEKVKSLMDTLTDPDRESLVPPVDILWIKGREGNSPCRGRNEEITIILLEDVTGIRHIRDLGRKQ